MKEDEILEFTFRSIRKKRRSSPGCPNCGETMVSNGKTYDCRYSSSSKGVTPCKNLLANDGLTESEFLAELKESFKKKKG